MQEEVKREKMTLASQPEILRTTQRDLYFRNSLNMDVLEVLELLFKYNIITKYE